MQSIGDTNEKLNNQIEASNEKNSEQDGLIEKTKTGLEATNSNLQITSQALDNFKQQTTASISQLNGKFFTSRDAARSCRTVGRKKLVMGFLVF